MDIKILKKIEYKGFPIYIWKFDYIFVYFIIYKGELYSKYFDIKPSKIRGSTPLLKDYSKTELDNIVKMVYFAAYKTIDDLKKNS